MSDQSRIFPRRLFWILNFLLWTVIAALQAFQNYVSTVSEGGEADAVQSFLLQLSTFYPWAVFSPFLYAYFRRFPLDKFSSRRTLIVLPLLAIGCITLQIASHTAGMIIFPSPTWHPRGFWEILPDMLWWISFPGFLTFAAIVGACHAINYYQRFRERERITHRLEQELTEARLHALRMQLQPHFFFNTLHAIASLIRDGQGNAAVNMIAKLSDLFRYTLDQVKTQKISLKREIEFLSGYLEIEQTRFSDRLNVVMEIAPETKESLVPTLFLQPIIENSIKHGISRLSAPGTLTVKSERLKDQLVIRVTNDGSGIDPGWENKGTVGVRNTRQRLKELYGTASQFVLRENGDGRVTAEVIIPFEYPNEDNPNPDR